MLGSACAEGTEQTQLDPGLLNNAGSSAGPTGGMATAGSSALAGNPGAGGTSAGASAMAGAAGSAAGSGGAPLGGAGGKGGAGGSGGATSGAGGRGGMGGAAGMGGSVGTTGGSGGVGTAGMAGTAGAGGSGATSYRYVKLVANSEQNSAVWSAVAELQVMTTGGAMIARTAWTITADSQETDDEQSPATSAIDGNPDTFWHTAWEPAPNDVNDAKLPHSLTVDMGVARPITGFSYLPRQNNPNGRIKGWEFYVSTNGTTWGTPVKAGTFPAGATLQTVSF